MNNVDFRVLVRAQTKAAWNEAWATVPYLEPLECVWSMAPRVSQATLLYRFGEIMAEDQSNFAQRDRASILDHWVRIQIFYEETEPAEEDWVNFWVGVIRDDSTLVESKDEEGYQTLTAFGLESLLQTAYVEKAKAYNHNDDAIDLAHVPTFNRRSKRGRTTLGNRSEEEYELEVEGEVIPVFIFGSPTQIKEGFKWNFKQIAEHLLRFNGPEGIDWAITGQSAELELIEEVIGFKTTDAPESLFDALNKLIENKRGFCWHVDAREASDAGGPVNIVVRTINKDDLEYLDQTLHANDQQVPFTVPEEFPFTHLCESIRFRRTSVNKYDKIVVQGNPCRRMETFHMGDGGGLTTYFNATGQTEYNNAGGAADAELADLYRQQERLDPVYRWFEIRFDWDGIISDYDDPDDKHNAVPVPDNSGNVDYTTAEPEELQFWASQKCLSRDTFIQYGIDYSVYPPERTTGDHADDEFRSMQVMVRDRDQESPHGATDRWFFVDRLGKLTAEGTDLELKSASVRPLERAMGFALSINPGHYFGLTRFSETNTSTDPEFNYDDLLCTACFTTDKRQQIVLDIADPMPAVPRVLYYTVRGAEHWSVGANCVIDIDETGQPVHFDVNNSPVRDDFELLEANAAMLKAWYTENRQAARLHLRRVHPWVDLGQLLTSIEAAGWEPVEVNTVVTQITTNFTRAGNGVTIETGYEDLDYVGIMEARKAGGGDYRSDGFGEPIGGASLSDYPLSAIPLRDRQNDGPRPQMLIGSLAERLGGARHRYALFNVMPNYPHGGPDHDADHGRIGVAWQPSQIYVWDFSRWNKEFGATTATNDDGYGPGTNGSAHWADNFGCYLFVPDCGTVVPATYEEEPSSPSGPSDPGFEAAYYCITNGVTTCCMFLTTEADLPPGYTVDTGPYAASNCDMVCAACE